MRHMLGNLSPNYFERTKRYMMLRASQQGTDLTVSGTPPLSLPNSLGKPLKAWSVELSPYQEGSGDPAPDNVRAIYGTDKVTIYTDSKYGGLVEWNQLFIAPYSRTGNGITITRNSLDDPYLRIDGTATAIVYVWLSDMQNTIAGHVYFVDRDSTDTGFYIYNDGGGVNTGSNQASVQTATDSKRLYVRIANGATFDNFSCRPMICDLTEMFGAGNEPSTVEEFRALFPNDYYAYNAGQQMTVDQVNGAQYSPAVITLPQTVYTATIGESGGESRSNRVKLKDLTWTFDSAGAGQFRTNISLPDMKTWPTYYHALNWYCNVAKIGTTNSAVQSNNEITATINSTYLRLRYDDANGDVTTFMQMLTETDAELVYETAEPTAISITTPTIPTPSGTATTWATAEDGTVDSMEVTYVGKA